MLRRERVEAAYRKQDLKRQARSAKRRARLERTAREAAALAAEAEELVIAVKASAASWPRIFLQPELAEATSHVERLLQDSPDGAPLGSARCVALRGLAGRMREVISRRSPDASFQERVQAMKTVKQLEYLADEVATTADLLARQ